MASIVRGSKDIRVKKVKVALDSYEKEHAGSIATLYRQNPGSIRVRIIDKRFSKMSTPDRHDLVWDYLVDHLDEDAVQEISILLLLPPAEQKSSFMNHEFDDPIPSAL